MFELITGSWLSAAIGAIAELGVADVMSETPRPARDLAKEAGVDADCLHRLLATGTDIGLFRVHTPGYFSLTPLGRTLRSDSGTSMRGFARWIGSPAERGSTAYLAEAVRSGNAVFSMANGKPAWDYLHENPDVQALFNAGMTDISAQITVAVATTYDFSAHSTLVDVGGGQGRLLAAILAARPRLDAILYDKPEVVAHAAPVLEQAGVADRCRVVGGDFLTGVPRGGDAYLLSSVIHNWDDPDATRILSHCRDAAPAHGRVLMAEAILPPDGQHALSKRLLDLSMLANCSGRQRTETEFAALCEQAGLTLLRTHHTDMCSVVEAGALATQPRSDGSRSTSQAA
ncbi:methyltransferase [Streptomyces sp. NPDC048718]|uniref:methyltransferase n=1 Tax=Streptomyces sp. NPDC048718 TaxID=3365587 RepID=UPI0037106FD5